MLGWKKRLGLIATFAGTVIGTMHIINKVFSYIATADDYLDENSYEYYNWRFGKIAYKKKGKVLLFFLCITLTSVHPQMSGKI